MSDDCLMQDGLSQPPAVTMKARQLLGTVCVLGGAACPLWEQDKVREVLARVKHDPTVSIRLESDADRIPYFRHAPSDGPARPDPADVLNRKRDLDVLQRLGLAPGDTRRARYLYMHLFDKIETPYGICAYDTPGWEGCPLAKSGAYESVRAIGWQEVVYLRSDKEQQTYRDRNVREIATAERLLIRPHHFMCLACWYNGGEGHSPRPNDTLCEILARIREQPDIPITLVEGPCVACDCCDGLHPETGRCVHDCGLIRDYKKDLDVFQKLGLMPGATLPANELIDVLFDRVPSTRDICGYGDGTVTSREWSICREPEGCPGYTRTRQTGLI